MSLSILIGEDNLFTLKQYEKILEKNGHKVTVTTDGDECVKKYTESLNNENKSNPFDVVLIDNNMPKKSGAEAAQEILEKRPNQRIIFASAYDIGSLLNAQEFIKKSVEILQKPFSLNSLVAKIQNRK
jgi:two-component system, cell cycle response regulator CpdR